jgi:tetratricopeptide (TPR) repeat protein
MTGGTMKKRTILCGMIAVCIAACLLAVIPQQLYAQAQKGIDLFKSRQYRDAEAAFREALKADPSDVQAHYYFAVSLIEQEKYQDALPEIIKAQQGQLRADQWTRSPVPSGYQVQIAPGRIRLALKNYDEALRNLDSARIEDGNSAGVYLYRGMCFLGQKKNAEAVKDFEKVIRLAPNSPEAARAKQLMQSN